MSDTQQPQTSRPESAPAVVRTDAYQGADYPRSENAVTLDSCVKWIVIGGIVFIAVGGVFVAAGPQLKNFFADLPPTPSTGGAALSCTIYR